MVRRVVREERIRAWKSIKSGFWRSGRRSVRVRGVDNERGARLRRRCSVAAGDKIRSGARWSGARRSAAANMCGKESRWSSVALALLAVY